ncbi:hypothetical protein BVRB_4g092500 [Beta vulgaris subsp. vulgaris]|nr:hypothetical protein BVRB_4g092500 [Beta vulgaris subsp. vulgaris]
MVQLRHGCGTPLNKSTQVTMVSQLMLRSTVVNQSCTD